MMEHKKNWLLVDLGEIPSTLDKSHLFVFICSLMFDVLLIYGCYYLRQVLNMYAECAEDTGSLGALLWRGGCVWEST